MFKKIRIALLLIVLAYACWLSWAWLRINELGELDVKDFNNGVAVAQKNGKYGYINEKYDVLIDYQFDIAHPFINDRAIVGISFGNDYKYRLIDEKGTPVSGFYDKIKPIGMDRFKAFKNTKNKKPDDPDYYAWQLMDKNGKILTQKSYTHMDDFFEGKARVCIKKRCGFINESGTEQILIGNASTKNKVAHSADFSSGKLDDRTGADQSFHDGLAISYKDGLYGFMNTKAQTVISHQFLSATNFNDGLAIVQTKDGHGVINTQGNFIITPNHAYQSIKPFHQGYGIITKGKYALLADRHGNIIVSDDKGYESISQINEEGLFMVKKGEMYGFIDKTGKVVLPLIYSEVWGDFENGVVRVTKADEPNKIYYIDKKQKVHGESTLTVF